VTLTVPQPTPDGSQHTARQKKNGAAVGFGCLRTH